MIVAGFDLNAFSPMRLQSFSRSVSTLHFINHHFIFLNDNSFPIAYYGCFGNKIFAAYHTFTKSQRRTISALVPHGLKSFKKTMEFERDLFTFVERVCWDIGKDHFVKKLVA